MSRKFNIIKKKNLPNEANVSGFSFLKKPTDKDKQRNRFDFIETSDGNEIGCKLPNKKAFAYTKGYVRVDNKENTFVAAKGRGLIFAILFALLAVLLFVPLTQGDAPIIEDLPIIGNFDIVDQEQTRPTEEVDTNVPTITFAGYGKYTVNKDYPSVEVKNPEGNFVDMVFTLSDQATGEIIARTGKVAPGKFAYVNVMDFYTEPGVYTLLINVAAYDSETGAAQNGVNQKMELTVE